MCDGHLCFKWLKVGVCPWPAGSTPGHTSLMGPNELWTCPNTEPPGLAPSCQRRKLHGLFEEQEEGTGVVSDVVKVTGVGPATPGPLV